MNDAEWIFFWVSLGACTAFVWCGYWVVEIAKDWWRCRSRRSR